MLFDDYVRILLLLIIIILPLYFNKYRRNGIIKFISSFLILTLVAQILPIFYTGYNLLFLSIVDIAQLAILSLAIYYETSKLKIPLIVITGGISFFLFLYSSSWSSYSFINEGIAPFGNHPIGLHQFFDLLSLVNIGYITLMFHWLIHIVNLDKYDRDDLRQRYFFIFGFLIYAGGSFFMVAFGRIIIPSLEEWFSLWEGIFHPIWIIFYSLLFIGLLWKPIRS
jgi:hypothetical protein